MNSINTSSNNSTASNNSINNNIPSNTLSAAMDAAVDKGVAHYSSTASLTGPSSTAEIATSTTPTKSKAELAMIAAATARKDELAAQTAQVASMAKPTPATDGRLMTDALELAGLGEELGQFKAYDSQLTIADITGTRIIKCLYQKSPKTGLLAQANSYVRIPTKHLTEEFVVSRIAELSPFVVEWLQGVETDIIKASHKKGALNVFISGLSIDSIVEHLEASSESGRLTKEKIEAWYVAEVQDGLEELFADKMSINEHSTDAEVAKLELIVGAYKIKFTGLANGKAYLKAADCDALMNVINTVDGAADTVLGARFLVKLEKMKGAVDELLVSL